MYVMCLETRMAIWEAEYCSGGYAQHSGANCGGDHGQVYSGSYKVGSRNFLFETSSKSSSNNSILMLKSQLNTYFYKSE